MLDDGSAIASWVEFAGERSQFKVRRVNASGQRSAAADVPGATRASGYPRMVRSGNELILVWTETEGGQQVKAAVASALQVEVGRSKRCARARTRRGRV